MLKKILKVTAFVLITLITLIAVVVVEENIRGKRAWERHLRELEAKGDTLDILKIAPPPIPDAQNLAATPLFAEIMTVTNQSDGRLYRMLKGVLPTAYASGDWQVAWRIDLAVAYSNANLLATLAPAADVLKEVEESIATHPQCRFPIKYEKGFESLIPHASVLMSMNKVLRARALAELQAGQTEAAFRDVLLMFRLGNAMAGEPVLISMLVRTSIINLALQPVWEGLQDHRWTDDQLKQLQQQFAELDMLAHLDLAMHGERCMAKWCLTELLDAPRALQLLQLAGSRENNGVRHELELLVVRLIPSGWVYLNCLNVDLCYQQRILPCFNSKTGRIYPDRSIAASDVVSSRGKAIPYHVLERLLVPAVSSCIMKAGKIQTAVESAQIACALERYRLAHGGYPDKLDALVPQFIAAVPRDVIDGQPLRYRKDGAGFVIYSIGWNQKDDGGQMALQKPDDPKALPRLDEKEGDWLWRSKPTP